MLLKTTTVNYIGHDWAGQALNTGGSSAGATAAELRESLGRVMRIGAPEELVNRLVAWGDISGDGRLRYVEFARLIRSATGYNQISDSEGKLTSQGGCAALELGGLLPPWAVCRCGGGQAKHAPPTYHRWPRLCWNSPRPRILTTSLGATPRGGCGFHGSPANSSRRIGNDCGSVRRLLHGRPRDSSNRRRRYVEGALVLAITARRL